MSAPSLVPLIVEAERVLAEAIDWFGLTVRPSQILFTIQHCGRFSAYGWFSANRWQNGKPEALHEINLSAEHLKECDIGEVLLHELAHAENKHLHIQDCSGQRHNKNFKRMAERLGLIVDAPHDTVGFGITKIGAKGAAFLEDIAFKRELFSLCRLGAVVVKEPPGSRLVKWECPDCGYTMRLTRKWLSKREPACPLCNDASRSEATPAPAEVIETAAAAAILTEDEIAGAADAQLIKIEKTPSGWRLRIFADRSVEIWEARDTQLRAVVENLWLWMKEAHLLERKES